MAVTKERPVPLTKDMTAPAFLSFTSFNLADFKKIRKATGAHFMAIFQTLLGGVTRRIALDNAGPKAKVQDNT